MIRVRQVETDAELEAWRQIRMAVVPDERTPPVERLRASARPERLFLLAERDGEVVGSSVADRSDIGGRGVAIPRVLQPARRCGVGTALLRASVEHVASLGFEVVGTLVGDDGSRAFAERFGFCEVNRDVEQVREIVDEVPPRLPTGIEIVSVAERPELWREVYHTVAAQGFTDMAVESPLVISLEDWERDELNWPEGTFVALADGEPVGTAGLMRDFDRPERAENGLTAVRRDWRRRGVASALKRTALAFAAANGIREVYTWTQRGNEDMRRVNERLGYVYRGETVRLVAPVPLPRNPWPQALGRQREAEKPRG